MFALSPIRLCLVNGGVLSPVQFSPFFVSLFFKNVISSACRCTPPSLDLLVVRECELSSRNCVLPFRLRRCVSFFRPNSSCPIKMALTLVCMSIYIPSFFFGPALGVPSASTRCIGTSLETTSCPSCIALNDGFGPCFSSRLHLSRCANS